MSALPGLRIPRSAGRWPSKDVYADYLEAYAARFDVDIEHGCVVDRIDPAPCGYALSTSTGALLARCVVVATGPERLPYTPAWPGLDTYGGSVIHAAEYKRPDRFGRASVLVVGAGNSGAEIATELSRAGASVKVSMRTPPNIMKREILGIPSTLLGKLNDRQPLWMADRIGFLVQRLTIGNLSQYGVGRTPIGVATQIHTKNGPTIDSGFVAAIKEGAVRIVPAVARFDRDAVVLVDGTELDVDYVIAATGYKTGLESLVGQFGILLPNGFPEFPLGHPSAPGLFFNGYRVSLIGLLPNLRRTSRRIARLVKREVRHGALPVERATRDSLTL